MSPPGRPTGRPKGATRGNDVRQARHGTATHRADHDHADQDRRERVGPEPVTHAARPAGLRRRHHLRGVPAEPGQPGRLAAVHARDRRRVGPRGARAAGDVDRAVQRAQPARLHVPPRPGPARTTSARSSGTAPRRTRRPGACTCRSGRSASTSSSRRTARTSTPSGGPSPRPSRCRAGTTRGCSTTGGPTRSATSRPSWVRGTCGGCPATAPRRGTSTTPCPSRRATSSSSSTPTSCRCRSSCTRPCRSSPPTTSRSCRRPQVYGNLRHRHLQGRRLHAVGVLQVHPARPEPVQRRVLRRHQRHLPTCGRGLDRRHLLRLQVGGRVDVPHAARGGWRTVYIPTELAVGDTPETVEAYTKQQLRWATGGFEIMLTHNPLSPKRTPHHGPAAAVPGDVDALPHRHRAPAADPGAAAADLLQPHADEPHDHAADVGSCTTRAST